MADLSGGPRRPRPPLTKRMRRGHWVALDCVVGALAALATVLPALSDLSTQLGPFPGRLVLALPLAAAVFVPVGFRRVRPVPAFGALLLVAVIMDTLLREPQAALVVMAAAAYTLYTVTVESPRRTGAAALGLAFAVLLAIFLGGLARASGLGGNAVLVSFVLLTCWLIGNAVRQRRLYADALQNQAASKAVTEERLRIARELHDVVAHSMSVIAVQAGFGQYVIDSNPSGAKDALGAIQATSRDALEEMRRMLGVLRHQDVDAASSGLPDHGLAAHGLPGPGLPAGGLSSAGDLSSRGPVAGVPAPLAPAPGLTGLDRLVERTAGTGLRVTLDRCGAVRSVPATVDLSAYRILQEALTNVVKHAGADASCAVFVRYSPEALVLEVTDDGGSRPALGGTAPVNGGHGIIGMRERAALCGGSLEAGPAPSGGFRVTATLPLPAAPASTASAGSIVSAGSAPGGRPEGVPSSVMDEGRG